MHALLDERRSVLVVVGEAAVGEEVPIARIQEQLGALGLLRDLAGDVGVPPLVGLPRVDLERDALRPGAAELRRGDTGMEQERSRCSGRVCASICAGITPSEKPA